MTLGEGPNEKREVFFWRVLPLMRRTQTTSRDDRPEGKAVHTPELMEERSSSGATPERDFTERGEASLLMERVVDQGNMLNALRRVERNKGGAGVDGMDVGELRAWYLLHHEELRKSILEGSYRPEPVRREEIPKASGRGVRLLGIPTVKDRLIQQAILQVVHPIIDPTFSESSFGFRPGRSAHQAIDRAKKYVNEGRRYVVDLDLEDFFNRVNHDKLMSKVSHHIGDKRVLRLVRRYLESGVMLHGCRVRSEEGTPQGGPLSPLLSNILLDELDKELEKRGHKFCRYADDQNIYVRTQRAGERVFSSITKFIEMRLKLRVNREKSAVDRVTRRKFLGISFTGEREARICFARETMERFKGKIRKLTSRSWGISLEARIGRLNQYLSGWIRYYSKVETPSRIATLRSWIHRRLRLCVIYRWKRSSTWWKGLVALGVDGRFAAHLAKSCKGWWRLSLTPQLHKAMGARYWTAQSLFDISEAYRSLRNAT